MTFSDYFHTVSYVKSKCELCVYVLVLCLIFLFGLNSTEAPRYNDSVCYQRFCCKIEFAVIKKLYGTHLKHQSWILLNSVSIINHTFCVFVRIASARQNVCFLEK